VSHPEREIRKGRGAQSRQANRFEALQEQPLEDFLEHQRISGESEKVRTGYLRVHPKTIVNKVTSPDVGMSYSMNPYQGCEHGCVYCYARNSHEYWGYGPGLDFESKILVKENAPALLDRFLKHRSWKAAPIVLSGNTDCYQPAEREFGITRACLEIFHRYRHPVGIITKNALVLRDMDLLTELHADGLVGVNISVTSLDESTRRLLEPRTASIAKRLETIRKLSDAGIPVNAMLAPIIPGINSHEVMDMAQAVADAGARSFGFTLVRLNGAIAGIFTEWLHRAMPDRAGKILSQIRACHGGSLNDSRFGIRNKGEGAVASQIHQLAGIARKKYFAGRKFPELNTSLHAAHKSGQWELF